MRLLLSHSGRMTTARKTPAGAPGADNATEITSRGGSSPWARLAALGRLQVFFFSKNTPYQVKGQPGTLRSGFSEDLPAAPPPLPTSPTT